jgi:CRISPR-associated exonuclease Cas4
MPFSEDDLLPLSGLQHLAFCERQWALIHLEGAWAENRLTAEGRILHERVHENETEARGGVRIARGLRLRSWRLGLIGMSDVVEFHKVEPGSDSGVPLPGAKGLWRPVPVEYKRGRPKPDRSDETQLCAQALCLEEMLNVSIPEGVLFYGKPHRRYPVTFDAALRSETEALAAHLHALFDARRTPPAVYAKKCEHCSLLAVCKPRVTSGTRSARKYLARAIQECLGSDTAEPKDTP